MWNIGPRLNVGCGHYPIRAEGWVNIDSDPTTPADIHFHVPPIPASDNSLEEIYAGHFLEHLDPTEAIAFLKECLRCLVPGGKLGLLVPDTKEVMTRYVTGAPAPIATQKGERNLNNLDHILEVIIYSTVQDSPHLWSYDITTLTNRLVEAGFNVIGEFDRYTDPRIALGAWYQVGVDSVKPLQ